MSVRRIAWWLSCVVLAGCGGSGGSGPSPAASAVPSQAPAQPTGNATVTFQIAPPGTRSVRRAQTLPAATTSVAIVPSNGSPVPTTYTIAPLDARCTGSGTYSCTVVAYQGSNVTFDVQALNSASQVLSHGVSAAVTISAANPSPIAITTNPVVASVVPTGLALYAPYGPTTTLSSLSANALDASGNLIGSTATFDTPVTVTSSDPANWTLSSGTASNLVQLGSIQPTFNGSAGGAAAPTFTYTVSGITVGSNANAHAFHALYAESTGNQIFVIDRVAAMLRSTIAVAPTVTATGIATDAAGDYLAVLDGTTTNTLYNYTLSSTTASPPHSVGSTTAVGYYPTGFVNAGGTTYVVNSYTAPYLSTASTPTAPTGTAVTAAGVTFAQPKGAAYDPVSGNVIVNETSSSLIAIPAPYTNATIQRSEPNGNAYVGLAAGGGFVFTTASSTSSTLYRYNASNLTLSTTLSFASSVCPTVGCGAATQTLVMALEGTTLFEINTVAHVVHFPSATTTFAQAVDDGLFALPQSIIGDANNACAWVGGSGTVIKLTDGGSSAGSTTPVSGISGSILGLSLGP